METFLLNAISDHDDYDADIIKKGNSFVEEICFSVRTAAEQFVERQNVIKNVEWEKYVLIQKSFHKLGDL